MYVYFCLAREILLVIWQADICPIHEMYPTAITLAMLPFELIITCAAVSQSRLHFRLKEI